MLIKNGRKCHCGYFNQSKLQFMQVNIVKINPKVVPIFIEKYLCYPKSEPRDAPEKY